MDEKNFEDTITGKEEAKREGAKDASEHNYEQYKRLGGIINEKDYQSALDRAKNITTLERPDFLRNGHSVSRAKDIMILDKELISQAETMARVAGITLRNSEDALDPRTILYGILRRDTNPGVEYHHSQMSDQRLFAEVLRMLGDADSLQKLIETHPNISFNW